MSEKRARFQLSSSSDSESSKLYEKRQCLNSSDNNDNDFDGSTIIVDPLSSTRLEAASPIADRDPPFVVDTMASPTPSQTSAPVPAPPASRPLSVREEVIAAFTDPAVITMITTITKQVIDRMEEKFSSMQTTLLDQIRERDTRIQELETKLDAIEQYSRRNSLRISGVPEIKGEDTDAIAIATAKTIGVDLSLKDIDRSHRVGPMPQQPSSTVTTAPGPRPIIVKLATYRYKAAMMGVRTALKNKKASDILSLLSKDRPAGSSSKVFLNDDLTGPRARLAADARKKKKAGIIQDTWTRDGEIFIRRADRTRKIYTANELNSLR